MMAARITVVRTKSFRSFRLDYEIRVDGEAVGRVQRGQTLTHEIDPGEHEVQAFFAAAGGGRVNEMRRSVAIPVDVHEDESVDMHVDLGPATSARLLAQDPTATRDSWLTLTSDGYQDASKTAPKPHPAPEAITRIVLAVIIFAGFVTSLLSHPASPLHVASQIAIAVAAVVLAVLLYRHFQTMRS
jgi:hypothetical protein